MTTMALGGALLGGGIGTVLGYLVGRTRAELGRALFDGRRGMAGRRDYRK